MEHELTLRGLAFQPRARVPLQYKGAVIQDEELVMDVYLPSQLVVELKAVERLLPVHQAQLLTYLRLSATRLGLLINFNVPILRTGIKRMVLG